MNYKFKDNKLISKYSTIEIEDYKGHLKVTIILDHPNYKFKITQQTSIKSDLTQFERKVVLIHIYKLIDRFKTNIHGLRNEIYTNYATIFGCPWL